MAKNTLLKNHRPLLLAMFEMDIPIVIIAKAMGVTTSTVAGYYKRIGKKDSRIEPRRTLAKTHWRMLAVYTSFLADPTTYQMVISGTKHDIMQILERELNIKELYVVIMTQLRFAYAMTRPTFETGVPTEEQRFISDVYLYAYGDHGYGKKPSLPHAKEIAKDLLIGLHTGKFPFPKPKEFANREEFYASMVRYIHEEVKPLTAPIVSKSIVLAFKQEFLEKKRFAHRHRQSIEYYYKLNWVPLDSHWQMSTNDATKINRKGEVISWMPIRNLLAPLAQQSNELSQVLDERNTAIEERDQVLVGAAACKKDYTDEVSKLKFINAELKARFSVPDAEMEQLTNSADASLDTTTEAGILYRKLTVRTEDMGLSVRAFNCLKAARIDYMWILVQNTVNDFLKFRNFGKKTLVEIELFLHEQKLSFGSVFTAGEIALLKQLTYEKDNRTVPHFL